ncbi:MAG: hypothetical protein UR26_C0006G0013 [candidate division TM6 bacterium GW2011_GWF2_32_72]|nr:MAG: hypothetical protein UR26_C0006G0013 [candidate division TM6 bacterium GW2011_GWF2_32_72]
MMKKIILFLSVFFINNLLAVVIGSYDSVSTETCYIFPASDSDNEACGFAWFKEGFALEDNATSCTFSSVYPVSGDLNLNGGNLYLVENIILHDVVNLVTLGHIYGYNHLADLAPSVSSINSVDVILEDLKATLRSDVELKSTITVKGSSELAANGFSIDFDSTGKIVVDSGSSLRLKDVTLSNFCCSSLYCVDDSSNIILDNVKIVLSEDYTFSFGSIQFLNDVELVGSHTFIYSSSQSSSIHNHSRLCVTDDCRIAVGRHDENSDIQPLVFEDNTSCFKLDNCNLLITGSGITFSKGTIELERSVVVEMESTSSLNGLRIGTGIEAEDSVFRFDSGASVLLNRGWVVYNNYEADKLKATSDTARLIRGLNSKIRVDTDIVFPQMVLEFTSLLVSPISVAAGKYLTYDGVKVRLPNAGFELTSRQQGQWYYILGGDHLIELTSGSLPLVLVVQNDGNIIQGLGGFAGYLTLADSNAELSCGFNDLLRSNILMNNGKIILTRDLKLDKDIILTGSGRVDIGTHQFIFGPSDLTWTSTIDWLSNNGSINFNSKMSLASTWTFSGDTTIFGDGGVLHFADTGQIVVEDGVTLKFKNLCLCGLKENNLKCLGNGSKIILENVSGILFGDYTFDTGSFYFVRNVDLKGSYSFLYESYMTSTIACQSELKIADKATIKIGRKNGVEPLEFENISSKLTFDDCGFIITTSGMNLLKGDLFFNNVVTMDMEGSTSETGLVLGNGQEGYDAYFKFNPGATIIHNSGWFTYNNYLPNCIQSQSASCMLKRKNNSYIHINQDITFPNMGLNLESHLVPDLSVRSGVVLDYSSAIVSWPQTLFDIKAKQYQAYVYTMFDDDYVFMTKGTMPLYLVVNGANTGFYGSGGFSGKIILGGPLYDMVLATDGLMHNDVSLNGGTVKLAHNLQCAANAKFDVGGNVDLASYSLILGPQDLTWTSTIAWIGNNGVLEFDAQVNLCSTWTFSGHCIIHGEMNTLALCDVGKIVVAPNSVLTIKNLIIENIANANIECAADSKIILQNVVWVQSGDYIFENGSFEFKTDVNMRGDHIFVYESAQTSTILTKSRLRLDSDFTFSYDPSSRQTNLLEFKDWTSTLLLNGATIYTTTVMDLTKGTLLVRKDSILVADTDPELNISDQGFVFGDGLTSINDLNCEIVPGAGLIISSGNLAYKNLLPASWGMTASSCKLYFMSNTRFSLHESLNLGNGTLEFEDNVTFATGDDAFLTGDSIAHGALIYTDTWS